MASTVGAEDDSERTLMEQFGSGGLALLPWTKQMLGVLWVQFRLLLQVIYYTFMSGKSPALLVRACRSTLTSVHFRFSPKHKLVPVLVQPLVRVVSRDVSLQPSD